MQNYFPCSKFFFSCTRNKKVKEEKNCSISIILLFFLPFHIHYKQQVLRKGLRSDKWDILKLLPTSYEFSDV